ncbi:two-component system, chemotaxis family, response regulator CheB [Caloramator fervidus]|uniref:Protein-glutamate methylesterase/protein-glutamine glutaminase n=1 Tax=Caloramator fervidus TaxID=29344 RepID=A0A1H5WLU6_9CLOT|nr:chemotaxis response regulator protein-glutamate methylesterase [Caloramator fervidus]SEG00240.1 two-component system, chemotaxis family, response regulator CheB [Caloramator fervidus]
MFEKIKVLVVDDSAFMRKMISDMINSQPDMEVIDTARDGLDALEKIKRLNPDVVTLDVEMPYKNGLEVLKEIDKEKTQVIMLSSLTAEGSAITIEALRLGAFDFIQKPSGSISLDIEKVKDDLVEKIRYANAHIKRRRIKPLVRYEALTSLENNQKPIEAILIGASTGGPKVLFELVTQLPKDLDLPVLIVQHMPAGFTKAFAERLDRYSSLKVLEAQDNVIINKNHVYIAPGGFHMLVNRNRIKLDLSPQVHGVRPAVDKLFLSAAHEFDGRLLAVILTGMGKDGAEGIKAIKQRGGITIAQDEVTSTVFGMPKAAIETGCIDYVLPDKEIANQIVKIVRGRS